MRDAAPLELLATAAGWFANACADALESTGIDEGGAGHPRLLLRLHPAAEPAALVAAGGGRLVFAAQTAAAGPGYHRYVCDAVRRFGDEFGVEWAPSDGAEGFGDPSGYFDGGDPGEVDRVMLDWLGAAAARARERADAGERGLSLSLSQSVDFSGDFAIATPLGPRDRVWLDVTAADPTQGADVFPWWEDGLTAEVRIRRALCRLWTDVRWRAPLRDEERAVLRAVTDDLGHAFREAPQRDFPWREWRELLAWMGASGTLAEEVVRRANGTDAAAPLVGYRRGDVRVRLEGGWSIRVPGALAEAVERDGTWHAFDHRRRVRFRVLGSGDDDAVPDAETLLGSGTTAAGALAHEVGAVRSRASIARDERGEELTALCAAPGSVAICTVSFDGDDDRHWALETWRSVERAALTGN